MGISAIIGGIGAAASAGNAVSNLVGGGSPTGPGGITSTLGTIANAAAYQQAGAAISSSAQAALTQQEQATQAETNALLPSVQALPQVATGLTNLLGAGPSGSAGELAALQATPGYQFTLNQGLQATKSQLSAMGLADSGSAIKGAAQYAEGLAGTTYQGIVSNYINSANAFQTGASNYGQIFQNAQNAQNNLNLDIGQGQAYGLTGMSNALNAGLQNNQPLTTSPSNPASPTAPGTDPYAINPGVANPNLITNQGINPSDIPYFQNYQIPPTDLNALGATPTLQTG